MTATRFLTIAALLAAISGPAFAQTKQDKAAPAPAPAATAPAKTATPPAAPAKATPVAAKVNLNTATAKELDALPQIGPARAKAIIDARTKDKFKNWDDFVARKVVPTNAEAAIKDKVSF
jgi:competence protein ComEA